MTDLFGGSPTTHLVASEILRNSPISRTHIASRNRISEGSVSKITFDLLRSGLVEEVLGAAAPDKGSKRGRPQTSLQFNPSAATLIGINLTHTHAYGIITNTLCEPKTSLHSRPYKSPSPGDVVDAISHLVQACLHDPLAADLPAPTMIGVSAGGHVVDGTTITSAPFLQWIDPVDLATLVSEACGLPSVVSNDLEALLLYEQWFGAGKGLSQFALVTLGVGMGYGLVNNDTPVTHPDNTFGLIGHILIDPDGPPCFVGARHHGCSQCLTDDSLADEYSKMVGSVHTFTDYAEDIRKGVPQARQLAARECFRLGVLVGLVANLTMPQKVLIGGESAFVAKTQIESLREGIREYRSSRAAPVPFEILDSTRDDWALGAAAVALTGLVNGSLSPRSTVTPR